MNLEELSFVHVNLAFLILSLICFIVVVLILSPSSTIILILHHNILVSFKLILINLCRACCSTLEVIQYGRSWYGIVALLSNVE